MIAKGVRPHGTRKALQRGTLTPSKDGVSSFMFDLGVRITSDVVIELRGSAAPYLSHQGDVVLTLLGDRIIR